MIKFESLTICFCSLRYDQKYWFSIEFREDKYTVIYVYYNYIYIYIIIIYIIIYIYMIVDLFFIDCPLQRLPGFQPETPAKKINMGFAKVNVFFFSRRIAIAD